MGNLLEELARSRGKGLISEESFVYLLLKVEEEQLAPAGFTLTASNTIDNWTVFKVRPQGSPEPCAEFEYLAATGEFRTVGSGPQ